MSDDTPTQRFDAQPPVAPKKERTSRLPLILIIVGAVLLLLVILLLVLLFRGQANLQAAGTASPVPTATSSTTPSQSPSAAPVPAPTPSQSHTTAPPPPPPSTGPAISTWLVNNSTSPVVYCDTSAPNPTPIQLSFKWASSNVNTVYFGIGTTDASEGPYFTNLPPSGDNSNFPSGQQEVDYSCPNHSQTYTLTVVGAHNAKVSKTVTVVNKGDQS